MAYRARHSVMNTFLRGSFATMYRPTVRRSRAAVGMGMGRYLPRHLPGRED